MKKRLKLIHILRQGGMGGAERLVQDYFRFHDTSRFEISLGVIFSGGVVSDKIASMGFPVTVFHMKNGFDVKNALPLYHHIKKNGIDIVHLHTIAPLAKLLCLSANPGVIIATDHGTTMGSPVKRKKHVIYANRLLNPFVDHFPAISMGMKKSLLIREKVPQRSITLMYNGVDIETISKQNPGRAEEIRNEYAIPLNSPIIGTIGRLSREKQIPLLLKAFQRLKQKGISFTGIIIGDGPDMGILKDMQKKYGLENDVIFTGLKTPVYPYLDLLDIFAFPSGGEAFSITILEAMAKKKPVLAFDVEGVNEAVVHGKTGFLVPFGDIAAFSDTMEKMIRNPSQLITMGENAFSEVSLKYDIKNTVGMLENLYEKFITP